MKLIVGLGNPGKKYEKTRHNVGFMVVDDLTRKWVRGEVKWEMNQKCNCLILKKYPTKETYVSSIGTSREQVSLVKPLTFMNGSGMAVAKILRYYDMTRSEIASSPLAKKILSDLWVVHDDVDLPLGKIKIRLGGAAAGHHGVESIIESLGTDKFLRFRLGIGHPGRGADAKVEKYVLREFDINERTELKHMLKQTVLAIEAALKDGPEKAMNQFNR